MKTEKNNIIVAQDEDILFSDIFDLKEIQQIQDLFADATGVASIITQPDGTPITNPSNFTRLCNDVIRKTRKGCVNCFKSDMILGKPNASGPLVQTCMSGGLWDAGASIIVGGKHIANWMIGQVLNNELNEQRMIDYASEIGADKTEFLSALSEVPVMSSERFKKISELLFTTAKELSEKAYTNLLLKKQIAEHEKANELLQKSQESLSITLNSIGDGVISTDNNGLIVSINPVAELLCACKREDAIGKPLIDVLHIINSETRLPAENPVDKVLEFGHTVELANHTALISRDGKEYNISDSAAPIKNREGMVTGVVLVFSDVTEKYRAEAAFRESERSKSVLLSNLPGMSYRCLYDRDWTMKFVSDGCFELTGYEKEDLINNHKIAFNDLILPEYREHLWNIWIETLNIKGKIFEEYQIQTADNQIKWVWEQGVPVFNNAGEIVALEGIIIDITERKQAEDMLQKERSMLRTLIDNIPETIYCKDLKSRKTLSNKAEVKLLGKETEAEVIGTDDFEFFPIELAEKYISDDQLVMNTGKPLLNREESILDENGQTLWLLTSKMPLRDIDGKIVGLIGISRNITERKQIEEEIKNERLFLRTLIDNIPETIYSKDLQCRKTLANKAEVKLLGGKTEADILGRDDFDFFPKEMADKFYANDQLVMKTGKSLIYHEELVLNEKGQLQWSLTSKMPLRDNSGQIVGLIGISRDITDRKQTEDTIQNERLLLRTLIDNIPDTIYSKDLACRKTLANKAEVKILGKKSEEDVLGKDDFDLFPKEIADKFYLDDQSVLKTGNPILNREEYIIDKNGQKSWILSSKIPIRDKDDQIIGLLGIGRDITDRKLAEETVLYERILLRTVINNIPDTIYAKDLTGRKTLVNKAEIKFLNAISEDEVLGKDDFKFYPKEIAEKYYADDRKMILTGIPEINKESFEFDVRGNKRWLLSSKLPLYDNDNQIIGLVGITHDITSRKRAEEALQNERLLLRTVLDNIPDTIYVKDLAGCKTLANKAEVELLGAASDTEVLGKTDLEFYPADFVERFGTDDQKVIESGIPDLNREGYVINSKGEKHYLLSSKIPLRNLDGLIIGVLGIAHDISHRKVMEEALLENERFLKETQVIAKLGTYTLDLTSQTWESSEVLNTIFGIEPDYKRTYKNWLSLIHPENLKDVTDSFDEVIAKSTGFDKEYKIIRHNDKVIRWVHVLGELVFEESNQPIKIIGTIQDITDRNQAEKALRESEEKYRNIFQNVQDVFFQTDMSGNVYEVSPSILSLSGYDRNEISGKTVTQLYADIENRDLFINPLLENGEVIDHEASIKTKTGEIKYVSVNARIICDEAGNPDHIDGAIRDITKRINAEEALRESETKYRELVDNSPDSIAIDVDGKYAFVNKEFIRLMGATCSEDLIGKKVLDVIHPDCHNLVINRINEIKNKQISIPPLEEKYIRLDGSVVDVEVKAMYVKLNNLPAIQLIIRDISERKMVDDMLKKSRAEFIDLFDHAPIGYHEIDADGRIVRINETETNLLGYTAFELTGKYIWALSLDQTFSCEAVEAKLSGVLIPQESYVRELVRKNGTVVSVLVSDTILKDTKGNITGIRSTIQDITGRKQAEAAKRESDLKFRNYIDFAPHGVFVADANGHFVEVNAALCKISGYNELEILSLDPTDFTGEDTYDYYKAHFKTVMKNGFASDVFTFIQKDRLKRYVSVDTVKLSENRVLGFVVDITDRKQAEQVLRESEVFLKETQMIAKLGNCTFDIQSGTWSSSEMMDMILGIDDDFDRTLEGFSLLIDPYWRKIMTDYFLMDVIANRNNFDKKFKIIRQNDLSERWIHGIGEVKYDSNYVPVKLIITIQDITTRKQTTDALRASEALYRSVLNASPDIIVVSDPIGKIEMISPAAMAFYQYNSDEQLVGHNLLNFVAPQDRERAQYNFKRMFSEFMGAVEYRILMANGSSIQTEINGDVIRDINGQATGVVIIIRDITDRKRAEEALYNSQIQLKQFAAHLQNVREEERISLAREIHDELGQILIAMKIDVGMLKQNVLKTYKNNISQDILTNFDKLFGLVNSTIVTTRKIMTDLRPEVLYLLGFVESAKLQTSRFEERYKIKCDFDTLITKLEVNTQQSVALYRILQESLTNIVKHSKATEVKVKLYAHSNKLTLEISDNGIGLPESPKVKPDSFGLIGMKERAFLLDADLSVTGKSGEGTTIKVVMPYFV